MTKLGETSCLKTKRGEYGRKSSMDVFAGRVHYGLVQNLIRVMLKQWVAAGVCPRSGLPHTRSRNTGNHYASLREEPIIVI